MDQTRSYPYFTIFLQYLMLCLRIPSRVVVTLITCTASKGFGICNESNDSTFTKFPTRQPIKYMIRHPDLLSEKAKTPERFGLTKYPKTGLGEEFLFTIQWIHDHHLPLRLYHNAR